MTREAAICNRRPSIASMAHPALGGERRSRSRGPGPGHARRRDTYARTHSRRRPRLFSRSRAPRRGPYSRAAAGAAPRLIRGQARGLALVDVDLAAPGAQRLRRATELTRELRDRPAATAQQPDRLEPERRRIRRDLWHRQTSSKPGQMAQTSGVYETGGPPRLVSSSAA